MKKLVIGIFIGALLMFSGQAFADTISRVGKKVGAEATVFLNGTQLSDAVIVDGKSFAPVRDIADAFGADVEFEPATKEKKAVITLNGDIQAHPPDLQLIIYKQEKEQLESELASNKKVVENAEVELKKAQSKLESAMEWEKPLYIRDIDSYTAIKEESEARITEINERLNEINAEISKLESNQQ